VAGADGKRTCFWEGKMQSLRLQAAVLLLGGVLGGPCVAQQSPVAPPALATPPPTLPAAGAALATPPAPATTALAEPVALGPPLAIEQLAQLRGGSDIPWSDMTLNATVANNSAHSVVTGANTITDGAFANSSGLPMVIQNSGANVLIQNATIINVQVK
jgi:hypothetical protein